MYYREFWYKDARVSLYHGHVNRGYDVAMCIQVNRPDEKGRMKHWEETWYYTHVMG